jgi:hypothetical protein
MRHILGQLLKRKLECQEEHTVELSTTNKLLMQGLPTLFPASNACHSHAYRVYIHLLQTFPEIRKVNLSFCG